MTRYDRDFRRIARSLSRLQLTKSTESEEDGPLDPDELFGSREDRVGAPRFLGFYGKAGLGLVFERYGLFAALARRGFAETQLSIRAEDDRHLLFVDGTGPAGQSCRLIELVVRRDAMLPEPPTGMPPLARHYEILTVDWLLLQNPLSTFDPERPRLPGQEHPGLGVGWRVLAVLYRAVERLGLSGLVTVADHLHNAEHYARELPFFDPAHAGRLRALVELLRVKEKLSVAQASWAMEWGLVRDGANQPVHWRGEAQVATEAPPLIAYLRSPAYEQLAQVAQAACRFTLDRAAFELKWSEAKASGLLFPVPPLQP